MGEKYAFSSMLHLVWAVVLVLGMGFVHFYMSMIATSFDPCPENQADANLKASIDKSNKYFNDIKMIHLGIACAIILTMLIGKAIVPKDGKNVCSIITIVLKLAACLIVVFGVSHAQNILKLRNKQCNNSIDEMKLRELKILIEACIGSIGVIIGNYLSLGINNLISFKMESSMSIIITTVVCILLVFSIIGGDALINIFKKELNIKNECVALNEELSKVDVSIGPANNILGGVLPDRLQLSGDKTYKDLNAGKTVITGKPIITTESESYEPGSEQDIKITFQQEQILKNNAIKIIFPSGFKLGNVLNNIIITNITPAITGQQTISYDQTDNSLTYLFPKGTEYTLKTDDGYFTLDIDKVILPNTLGFTEPIKLEIHSFPDDTKPEESTVEQVSYNNYFDLKDDFFITFDSLNVSSLSTMTLRIAKDQITDNKEFTLPSDKEIYFNNKEGYESKIISSVGHATGVLGKTETKELGSLKIEPVGDKTEVKQGSGNIDGYKKFKLTGVPPQDTISSEYVTINVPILTNKVPVKHSSLSLTDALIHKRPIEFIDPAVQQDTTCPVLSRDLFMKIFLTSVMTGWAVSSIVYLSGDLYEYNSSNIALMMGGGGGMVTDTAATAAAAAAAATTAAQNA
jgi:hypothetical protein